MLSEKKKDIKVLNHELKGRNNLISQTYSIVKRIVIDTLMPSPSHKLNNR